MWLKRLKQERRCSFCRKNEEAVRLISSPGDYSPRAYICDECIAVCARGPKTRPTAITPDPLRGRVSYTGFSPAKRSSASAGALDALADHFVLLVDRWADRERRGEDSSDLLEEMKAVIDRLLLR